MNHGGTNTRRTRLSGRATGDRFGFSCGAPGHSELLYVIAEAVRASVSAVRAHPQADASAL